MANLKGGNFAKQSKDAFHRLAAFGTGRHGKNDNKTHSDALAVKREMYLRDFSNFATKEGLEGKLNVNMNKENMNNFLNERLEGLAAKTAEDYNRGWSGMVQGLEEANIRTGVDKSFFDDRVAGIEKSGNPLENRYIEGLGEKIEAIERFSTQVYAELINETGFRASEAYAILENPNKYLNSEVIEGVIGKGNHEYSLKSISEELAIKIQAVDQLPSLSTLRSDLKEQDIVPHDLRYTFARDSYEDKISTGIGHQEALKEVSAELNHSREEITNYYLSRT